MENIICYVPELDALGITASSSIVSSSTKGVNAFSGENLPLGLTSTMGSPNEKTKIVLLKNNAIFFFSVIDKTHQFWSHCIEEVR